MDNARLDITNEGEETLRLALQVAFSHHAKATHTAVRDGCLVFYWTDPKDGTATPLLFPTSAIDAAFLATKWLLDTQSYGAEPDHDGDNGKGWRIFNEEWGHVFGAWEAIVAITPAWAMYGK